MRPILTIVSVLCLIDVTLGAALVVPAGEAHIHSVGQNTERGWNLWSNGDLGDYFTIHGDGAYRIGVRAWGSPAKGIWPEMAIVVDGQPAARQTAGSAEAKDYVMEIPLAGGVHRITVSFLNDALAPPEDRNLYVQSLSIDPPAGAAAPQVATAAAWTADTVRRENDLLAEADRQIEINRKRDALVRVLDAGGKPVADAAVRVNLVHHEFLFGCNIYMFDRFKTAGQNDLYKKRFEDLFNYTTVGFYWRWYETERGQPDYAYTDKVVEWCRQHGIRMKGHPLLWADEAGIPTWSKGQPSAEIQRERVRDIMRRYAGRIEFFEVVNEPAHLAGLKIDEPYRWARQIDPIAYLIVNDYEVMANGFPPFFQLLEWAKSDHVPFDGIGIQAHEPRTMRFPLLSVRRTLDHYATLGKDLHITEFTPTSAGAAMTGWVEDGKWDEAAQADYAAMFYRVCFAHPAMMGITWWDLSDQGSWLKGGGMVREDLSPKPVYEAIRKLVHEQWSTHAEGKTDAQGIFRFRGFCGDYQVLVNGAARQYRLTRTADAKAVQEWDVR